MSEPQKICEKQKSIMTKAECPRCTGNGYTESAIDDRDNPLEFSNGDCWQGKGTGICGVECEDCEREAIEEYYEADEGPDYPIIRSGETSRQE